MIPSPICEFNNVFADRTPTEFESIIIRCTTKEEPMWTSLTEWLPATKQLYHDKLQNSVFGRRWEYWGYQKNGSDNIWLLKTSQPPTRVDVQRLLCVMAFCAIHKPHIITPNTHRVLGWWINQVQSLCKFIQAKGVPVHVGGKRMPVHFIQPPSSVLSPDCPGEVGANMTPAYLQCMPMKSRGVPCWVQPHTTIFLISDDEHIELDNENFVEVVVGSPLKGGYMIAASDDRKRVAQVVDEILKESYPIRIHYESKCASLVYLLLLMLGQGRSPELVERDARRVLWISMMAHHNKKHKHYVGCPNLTKSSKRLQGLAAEAQQRLDRPVMVLEQCWCDSPPDNETQFYELVGNVTKRKRKSTDDEKYVAAICKYESVGAIMRVYEYIVKEEREFTPAMQQYVVPLLQQKELKNSPVCWQQVFDLQERITHYSKS